MNKQDWYLNQLNIAQYVLRKPSVLKGESLLNITDNIRLIIVSKLHPTEKIFGDILKAINLTPDNCLMLLPAQLIMPIEQINQVIWFINEPLPERWKKSNLYTSKAIIETVDLTELTKSPNLKRKLWYDLCQYENYFNTP